MLLCHLTLPSDQESGGYEMFLKHSVTRGRWEKPDQFHTLSSCAMVGAVPTIAVPIATVWSAATVVVTIFALATFPPFPWLPKAVPGAAALVTPLSFPFPYNASGERSCCLPPPSPAFPRMESSLSREAVRVRCSPHFGLWEGRGGAASHCSPPNPQNRFPSVRSGQGLCHTAQSAWLPVPGAAIVPLPSRSSGFVSALMLYDRTSLWLSFSVYQTSCNST